MDVGGNGYSTDEDRKIDFDKSKMSALLERRNHAKILTISLPTSGILISLTHIFYAYNIFIYVTYPVSFSCFSAYFLTIAGKNYFI